MRFCKSLILFRAIKQSRQLTIDSTLKLKTRAAGAALFLQPLRIRDLQFSQFPEMTKWKFSVGCGQYPRTDHNSAQLDPFEGLGKNSQDRLSLWVVDG